MNTSTSVPLAPLLQRFFTERLVAQRNASPHTVDAYRHTFRLLLGWYEKMLGKPPETLVLTDLNAHQVAAFLDYLETERHNTIRSRNARFAAIRSFLHFAAHQAPEALGTIQGTLALPMKRFERPLLGYLTREEIEALLDAPEENTWCGQRDRVVLATLYNTGARVSELIGLKVGDVVLDGSPCVHLTGKGRKQRSLPLWRTTANQLRQWLRDYPRESDQRLFPNRSGGPMTRTGVTDRLQLALSAAAQRCPSLATRRISLHTVRHATAMHLLQAGVDITVIAMWLGHESVATTHMYVEADLAMKERALSAIQAPPTKLKRFRPTKGILAFLKGL